MDKLPFPQLVDAGFLNHQQYQVHVFFWLGSDFEVHLSLLYKSQSFSAQFLPCIYGPSIYDMI